MPLPPVPLAVRVPGAGGPLGVTAGQALAAILPGGRDSPALLAVVGLDLGLREAPPGLVPTATWFWAQRSEALPSATTGALLRLRRVAVAALPQPLLERQRGVPDPREPDLGAVGNRCRDQPGSVASVPSLARNVDAGEVF